MSFVHVNQSSDPRIGSGRDNSTGGTLSHVSSAGQDSASLSALGSTFIPVAAYAVVCLILFIFLRTRCPRVYSPRSLPGILSAFERVPSLPGGWFNWVVPFFRTPDTFLLYHSSLDGFFFLRYVKVLALICFAGCCFTWPILLPIHGTGGRHLEQLDLLTIGNVASSKRLYGHFFVSALFFGFVLFTICRECIYYINLRQAYLLSPSHAKRLSSRTVMFTCVPRNLLDEAKVRKLFGDSVKNVWIPRNTSDLKKLVDEREETAIRLEKAEIELIKKANDARSKRLRTTPQRSFFSLGKGVSLPGTDRKEEPGPGLRKRQFSSDTKVSELPRRSSEPSIEKPEESDYVHPYGLDPALPDVRGSVAAQWIPAEARPHHRPLANFGRRVDTIGWTRKRIKALNVQIAKVRRQLRMGYGNPVNALFVEFDSQASAEAAYQIIAHHRPLHMSPAFIGIRPTDVVWSTLRMQWWERIIRRFLAMAAIAAGVIFWSIPSAFVGVVSKVSFLTKHVPFLSWITKLPGPILGVIEGLLPAVALSLLMAAVPVMLRACARASGVPSVPLVELYTQNAYFLFQVVQVFIVTTLTSAASAAFTQILENPLSAKDLLSENLPKASNFYLSYILVQCLAGGGSQLLHLLELVRHQLIAKFSEHPRYVFRTYHKLRRRHWGSVFPVISNLGVIALSYSCIAPLILGFAGLGMCVTYVVYKYNLMYSFESDVDTKGLVYPRALMHLIVGLYLAEVCLIGLFALQLAFAPLVMMVLYLIFTILVHISLSDAVSPLLYNLPRNLALQDRELSDETEPDGGQFRSVDPTVSAATVSNSAAGQGGGAADEYYTLEDGMVGNPDEMDGPVSARGVEGASGLMSSVTDWVVRKTTQKLKTELEAKADVRISRLSAKLNSWFTPDPDKKPNFVMRFLHPEVYEDVHILRRTLFPSPSEDVPGTRGPVRRTTLPDFAEEDHAEASRRGYWPPEMWLPPPKLWIPRDEARVSRQEVAHTREVTPITDQGAWLDERGRVVVNLDECPLWEPPVVY
ncbi:hypothetical protein VTK73DRAFT_571 [Phialemonium thermophilum]|uniref:DUF221-domain-containing protein n=1 Tax=Phialemonium thermophilum TaxID=223376 RepID=A0ABR3XEB7_9PEZI